jgi:hypothetical protein
MTLKSKVYIFLIILFFFGFLKTQEEIDCGFYPEKNYNSPVESVVKLEMLILLPNNIRLTVLSATGFSVERDPNKTYILTNI